jgi:hypothetical protein
MFMESRGVGGLFLQLVALGCVARASNYSKLSHRRRIARSSLVIPLKLSVAYQCLAAALDLSGPNGFTRSKKAR